jgi:dihydrolipoamide dehydrogenase
VAIRGEVPLDVLVDVIQPFPTFSEIYLAALKTLVRVIAEDAKPMAVASS